MTITESQRFALHAKLKSTLGDEMGTLLMEHLPPSGWSDVARKADLEAFNHRFAAIDYRFDAMEHRFDAIEHRFDGTEHRFAAIEYRLKVLEEQVRDMRGTMRLMIGSIVGSTIAILIFLIQISMKL